MCDHVLRCVSVQGFVSVCERGGMCECLCMCAGVCERVYIRGEGETGQGHELLVGQEKRCVQFLESNAT